MNEEDYALIAGILIIVAKAAIYIYLAAILFHFVIKYW